MDKKGKLRPMSETLFEKITYQDNIDTFWNKVFLSLDVIILTLATFGVIAITPAFYTITVFFMMYELYCIYRNSNLRLRLKESKLDKELASIDSELKAIKGK